MPINAAVGPLLGSPIDWTSVPTANPGASPFSTLGADSYTTPGLGAIQNLDLNSVGGTAEASSSAPFADLLTEAVGQVDRLERQARSSVEGLISGRGVDVHQAMIAAEKAGMGFELVLAVRSKALAAYQQVVGMQF